MLILILNFISLRLKGFRIFFSLIYYLRFCCQKNNFRIQLFPFDHEIFPDQWLIRKINLRSILSTYNRKRKDPCRKFLIKLKFVQNS